MFIIEPYPSDVEGRIQWCVNYANYVLTFVNEIYKNDRNADDNLEDDSYSTFEQIQTTFVEMRTVIYQVNQYIMTHIDPSTLTPYNLEVDPIRSIIDTLRYHEKAVTAVYNKWYNRYAIRKEEVPLYSECISTIEFTDDESDFQIR